MKKTLYFTALTFFSIVSFSCEDSIAPKIDFKEQYILNCVINGDSLLQLASLSKSYDVDGFDPYSNDVDPFIKNALIFIKHKGKTYQMNDTAITRTDTSRYKGPFNVYSLKSFYPQADDLVEVIAIPKEGDTLRGITKVPTRVKIMLPLTTIFDMETELMFTWSASDPDIYYLPRLKIYYTIRNEFPNKLYFIEVPLTIDEKGNRTYPPINKVSTLYFPPGILDKTMLKISENGEKENYKIVSLDLEVKVFDEILSNYISATNIYYDDLSIRLDEPTYTNIKGGVGIVGSSLKLHKNIKLSSIYIQALGYPPN